ncbi:kinesin [Chloropicon primus]|uniref:Kinesin-like protein n=1 Tax=Chloropicon primus TaxID=1764295 RepID=A0A5B8MPM5_9CHLO|nr:kinesin [Chloropicon primus]UPR00446.1 kinesin [Chloropicon primus]|eukprot:QDZ21232.1 kinesin [Chloropicon primus]
MSGRPSTSGKKAGSSKNIDIYLRCRPVPRPSENFTYDLQDGSTSIEIPHEAAAGYINNKKEKYDFKFNGIFGPEAKQDEVFDGVAKKVVLGALQGVNGTIFAYGQTGSGKTFTITGGAERYVDRGIIPRSISLIYQELEKRTDQQFSVSISYLEIYQGRGYDLLDPEREVKQIEDLPKVSLWEDGEGKFVPRNMSSHNAGSEEDALNLLFLGDTNRTISETPMNLTSSRSHCIFIVNIEVRTPGEDTVRRSKLNLVDLAGSERVAKTNIDGTILAEAQYINGSLHFLEQVIIALQEKATGIQRHHIPYRNSMMTAILKDSLGGNCCTAMVATVNMSEAQLGECISTCRFAQRVAMISNVVMVNEELDPKLMIKRLKQEIRDLKEEIGILKGGGAGAGEEEEAVKPGSQMFNHIKQQIQQYVSDASSSAKLNVGGSMAYIRTAFQIFKGFVGNSGSHLVGGSAGVGEPVKPEATADTKALEEQCKKYKLQIQQRDNEISILVSMMKKRSDMQGFQGLPQPKLRSSGESALLTKSPAAAAAGSPGNHRQRLKSPGGGKENLQQQATSGRDDMDVLANTNLLADRNKAFEIFRKSYRKSEAIEENKLLLKEKFQEAKALGRVVGECKQNISGLKASIEKRRMERAVQGLSEGGDDQEGDPQEDLLKSKIDREKFKYKEGFGKLKGLKREIEHIQKILENSRNKLQSDFEHWLSVMVRQQQGLIRSPANKQQERRQAWSDDSNAVATRKGKGVVGGNNSSVAKSLNFDFDVDPVVLQKAKPLLTGNAEADRDIIKFYQARQKLVNS